MRLLPACAALFYIALLATDGCKVTKAKPGDVAEAELLQHCGGVFRDVHCRCLSQNREAFCQFSNTANTDYSNECRRLANDEITLCHAQVAGQVLKTEAP